MKLFEIEFTFQHDNVFMFIIAKNKKKAIELANQFFTKDEYQYKVKNKDVIGRLRLHDDEMEGIYDIIVRKSITT